MAFGCSSRDAEAQVPSIPSDQMGTLRSKVKGVPGRSSLDTYPQSRNEALELEGHKKGTISYFLRSTG